LQYRGDAVSFIQDAVSPIWLDYIAPVSRIWRYIQVREVTAGVYYVAKTGNDSNSGTFASPFLTIAKAVSVATAGNTIRVMPGTYTESISLSKSSLTIIAIGTVIMKGFYISGSNNTVYGFTCTNPAANYGIRVSGNNNLIWNNEIYGTGQDGIWFFGNDNTYRGNYLHDICDGNVTHVDFFQTWGPVSGALFERNICHSPNRSGSNQIVVCENMTPPVEDLTFRNNIFIMEDPGYCPMNFQRKAGQSAISNINVLNNVFDHSIFGIGEYAVWFYNVTGGSIENNLVIDFGSSLSHYVVSEGGSTGITIDYNGVWKTDADAPLGGPYPHDVWMQDPLLVDLGGQDYRLTAGSPMVDTGDHLDATVPDDYDGRLRHLGVGYDIGAYECY